MRFGTWKCLTRALPPRSPKYSSKHRLCDLQRLCEVRCSSLACWYAMGAGKLVARCFALGGQPLNVGSCKVRFCGCLGGDKGCSQDTISIQFWLIQWQINLGIFSVQIENSIVTHDTVRRSSKPFQSHHDSMQAYQISKNISLQDSKKRIL